MQEIVDDSDPGRINKDKALQSIMLIPTQTKPMKL